MKKNHQMTMLTPAVSWRDGLPCGNGALCATVYGNISPETIQFNHDSLWYEKTESPFPDISDTLAECRRLALAGQFAEANTYMSRALNERGFVSGLPILHPAFDLKIAMHQKEGFTSYRRTLDFTTGEASVTWKDGKVAKSRNFFISHTDNVAVLRISSGDGIVDAAFQLCEHNLSDSVQMSGVPQTPPLTFKSEVRGDKLVLRATGSMGGEYGAVLRMSCGSGERRFAKELTWTEQLSSLNLLWNLPMESHETAKITGASEIVAMVGVYVNTDNPEREIEALCRRLDDLPGDYETLFSRHAEVHREKFLRCELALTEQTAGTDDLNESLLLEAYQGEAPLHLIEKMFDMGRYLLIACSSGECLPPTLQGTWNGDYYPPWNSFYVHNENTQMYYWQALAGCLPETMEAMLRYFEDRIEDYRTNARKLFGCRGVFIPLTAAADTGLIRDGQAHVLHFIGVAPWIAQHFYDYYLYTRDAEFLKERALPFMIEVARFYEDYLLRDEEGYVLVVPSNSPENAPLEESSGEVDLSVTMNPGVPLTINSTVDTALIRELLGNLCQAYETLGLDKEETAAWQDILAHLRPYRINEDGALAEWIHPDHRDNYAHRHLSHIYPLFPGFQITKEEQPELFEATRIAMEKRMSIGLEAQTGWSLAHQAGIYARMGFASKVQECFDLLSRTCLGPNLFTYHNDWRNMGVTLRISLGKGAPYQVDANMGITAAVLEALVFSTPHVVKLLPALPERWANGRIGRVGCRNGASLALEWDQVKRTLDVELSTTAAGAFSLIVPEGYIIAALPDGFSDRGNGTYEVAGKPGGRWRFVAEGVLQKESIS
ncbi:glycosyl hydrolase family 95 catalytic domain-containing protein [Cohnella nanjingensis]|uniref:Glycoside hydrolase N-terminal domain-containing protein n=1 Tax=Cohnella nanjingensis TaxID=1387779 RepID=A0A7X0VEC0_9BACL|nr:glycoside hydrolase N-terminal domain-containing protein [Cohnella nanjingensis]MBB6670118.1 glycoside hydrolase N-terminal domain-containing protein [Cohnella nanjingensis]